MKWPGKDKEGSKGIMSIYRFRKIDNSAPQALTLIWHAVEVGNGLRYYRKE
jgi:hypothetical protein